MKELIDFLSNIPILIWMIFIIYFLIKKKIGRNNKTFVMETRRASSNDLWHHWTPNTKKQRKKMYKKWVGIKVNGKIYKKLKCYWKSAFEEYKLSIFMIGYILLSFCTLQRFLLISIRLFDKKYITWTATSNRSRT